jgi:hypothetical protein
VNRTRICQATIDNTNHCTTSPVPIFTNFRSSQLIISIYQLYWLTLFTNSNNQTISLTLSINQLLNLFSIFFKQSFIYLCRQFLPFSSSPNKQFFISISSSTIGQTFTCETSLSSRPSPDSDSPFTFSSYVMQLSFVNFQASKLPSFRQRISYFIRVKIFKFSPF